jgi:ABC-2 type transport system permease protein
LPLLAFFIGWTLHNDLAFDGSAVWMHVTSGMSGLSDRFGRALPTLVFGTVVVVLGALVTWLIVGDWGTILALVGLSLGLLFAATGFSSIGSVLHPYPVARPGDSPFSQPVRSWGSGVFWHPTTGFIAILLMGPSVYAGLVALNGGESWWNLVALGWGVVVGLIVLIVGLTAGARQFERRSSEIMAFAQSA